VQVTGVREGNFRVKQTLKTVHTLGVLHRDLETRNILYDSGRLMVVDFERADFRGRQSLSLIALGEVTSSVEDG